MLLFLDVISSIPEFFIIEDNKVIFRRKIVKNSSDKLSDYIFETYIEIDKKFNLNKNITKIAMTVGPGSYTSLRIGASFVSGLKMSKNLPFCSITIDYIAKYKSENTPIQKLGFFITSSNNQKFFCYTNTRKEMEYLKIDNNEIILPKNINTIFYNKTKIDVWKKNIKQYKFYFIDLLLKYKKLNFEKNKIIKPIYVSNNKILN